MSTAATMAPAVHTIAEVAEQLRMDPRTIRKAIRTGAIKSVRLGVAIRVPAAELSRLLSATTVPVAV